MIGCVLGQLKPSEFYILSCEKGPGFCHSYKCRALRALSYTENTDNQSRNQLDRPPQSRDQPDTQTSNQTLRQADSHVPSVSTHYM